jgi:predicted small secreted protein
LKGLEMRKFGKKLAVVMVLVVTALTMSGCLAKTMTGVGQLCQGIGGDIIDAASAQHSQNPTYAAAR